MDIKKAFEILEIDYAFQNVTAEMLKKQYHIKSLQHHPDKNGNTLESTIKFREINEAYLLLRPIFTVEESHSNMEKENDTYDYMDLVNSFITEFSNKKYIAL